MSEIRIGRHKQREMKQELKQKALEPHIRRCYITKRDVSILIEYDDYKGPHNKGPEGSVFCEHILECYQKDVRCKYSGISPLFADPFLKREEDDEDQEESVDGEDLPEDEERDEPDLEEEVSPEKELE